MLPHPAAIAAGLLAELSARAEALLDAAHRVHTRADDEAVHDLRVANRRLSETLSLWRAAFDPVPARRARRGLARLRRALGDAREREVHLALLVRLGRDANGGGGSGVGSGGEALRLLRRRLEARLERARRRAAREARPRRIARILRRVERAGAGLADRAAATRGLVPHTAGRAARRLADARAGLAQAERARTDDALHAARVATKKARYAIESLAAVGVREDEAALRELRQAQRELGTAHDWATFLAWLGRVRDRRARRAASEAAVEFPIAAETEGLDALLERVRARLGEARAAFRPPPPGPGEQGESQRADSG